MLNNYFKIAFRILTKNKSYSIINILGLAIGIACCAIIFSYIQSELSYDTFHKNSEKICRVNLFGKIGDNEFNVANSPAPLAKALLEEFPEVENAVRIERRQNTFIKHNNSLLNEQNFFYADSTIFDVFTIELLEGNSNAALVLPNSVVITPQMAQKYFGNKNPVGQTIIKDDGTEFLITGIAKPFPSNSHFHFDFLASISTIEDEFEEIWISNEVYTYVLLNNSSSASDLENKIPKLVESRVAPQIEAIMGITFNEFEKGGNSIKFFVKPLTNIHLSSGTYANIEHGGSLDSLYIFTAIAIVILLLACINFVNLTTARSARRSSEVGVRKVLGSFRSNLIKQFLSESIIITFISLIVGIGLIELLLPLFNGILGKQIALNYFNDWRVIPTLVASTLLIGIIAGSYPAFLLSSFKPATVLKGKITKGTKGISLRGVVVVFQLSITVILLASTFIIFNQLKYIQSKKLGYNGDQIIILPSANELGTQKTEFKTEVLNNSNVINGTLTSSLPKRNVSATIFSKENSTDNQSYAFAYNYIDYDFLDTYQIELIEGRYFSSDFGTDTSAIIINETAVRELGFNDPIGKKLLIPSETSEEMEQLEIIGIVNDFHFENLREKIRPLVLILNEETEARFISFKVNPVNISETVEFIENKWSTFIPGKAFEYQFMDNDFDLHYQDEMRTGQLFTSFTSLAVFIACLGLLGLISFTVEQRTKEIGIRKVLGASISGIFVLLSKELLWWLVIANVIAIPVVYYFMSDWLENFAYRDNISSSVFFIATVLSFLLASITVSFHTIKAVRTNPVKSLKYE